MYPTSFVTDFINPYPSDQRSGHAQLHRDINSVVIALQAKVGIDASLDTSSIDWLVKSALNPGHTHSKDKVGLGNLANALQLIATNNLSDLTNVTSALSSLGISYTAAWLASQEEAEAGSNNTKLMTPLRVKEAINLVLPLNASDAEVVAWIVTNKWISAKQGTDNYVWTIIPSDIVVWSGWFISTNVVWEPITKRFHTVISKTGTYRIKFTMRAVWGSNYGWVNWRIYKNGIAYGTNRNISGTYDTTTEFTQDLTFSIWDTCEVWARNISGYNYPQEISNLKICFSLVPANIIWTIITP